MSNKGQKSALNVMNGIDQPPQINEEAAGKIRAHRARPLTTQEYLDGIFSGNRTILSKAITLVESNLPAHQAQGQEIIAECLKRTTNYELPTTNTATPSTGHTSPVTRHETTEQPSPAHHASRITGHASRVTGHETSVTGHEHPPRQSIRIGITGVPGVGKSTFIEALGKNLTARGHKLAVLAVDPSSSRSKGSILGDKTRMEELAVDPDAYIRPSPAAGSLGGVARKTRETIVLCEAAGFDVIFVETVGVGQSETTVHSMVDFFLLLMLAGAGDELQGIKRGIIEMADAIFINKADGDNLGKAKTARVEYANALHLFPPPGSGWTPVAGICSARTKTGIGQVWELIMEHCRITGESGFFHQRRMEQNRQVFRESIEAGLQHHFFTSKEVSRVIEGLEIQIMKGSLNPYQAAQELLEKYFKAG
ncbi:MAG: methylmalonyl Co-A mutase-associated GTPase MeaB [Bacteroidota bacterium]